MTGTALTVRVSPGPATGKDPMTAPNRPPLLLVGGGNRHYREYLLAALRPHFRLWLIDSADSTWPHDYVEGVTVADTLDADALIAVARQVTASFPARGVLTFDESLVYPVARVAEELGLPGSPPEAVQACRDKATSRAALDAAGVPQPISRTVGSAEEAVAAAEEIGYPVVVKARGLAGSLGVLRVDDPTAVSDAYATASGAVWPGIPRYEADVLVEEFLTGPEISIDAVISQSVCTPLVIAHKRTGFAPFFEETGHTVDADDPLFNDAALLGQLGLVHKGIGLTEGATHTEFKLTDRGPRLVEINARSGGDFIPRLGVLAGGSDPILAAAQIAVGQTPPPRVVLRRTAAIRFLYPAADCEVVDTVVHDDRFGPTIREALGAVATGTHLWLPPHAYQTRSRYGHVIAVGADAGQVAADLDCAEDLVTLRSKPQST
ncbi:carbamoyl-phosphate synthase L chain ATP-binding protein [Streptomyces violaceusniger Tu 4113]|uniref:Carbamoyl-phosphate synthase L chain ATP-binding protein n=2 Tax=Streptomyces violaceusniger TaxID=68280 RepID=G2NUD9_STRV4|nr:carbamoyl-phosphate synthase L chain ATP-binding protein [Streptomyces violaceusniger Tu 4113]